VTRIPINRSRAGVRSLTRLGMPNALRKLLVGIDDVAVLEQLLVG